MATAPVAPKFRRVIQPKDAAGNPVGNPHVYEGETEQEVLDKMADAIANGTMKIREQAIKIKTGGIEVPKAPEGAELDDIVPQAKPRELTETELFEITNDMKDPKKVRSAYARLYEAETGMKPGDDAKAREKLARMERDAEATRNANAFVASHPDYYPCRQNQDAIVAWMGSRNLRWTMANIESAYKELNADGLLASAPQAEPEPATPPARTEAEKEPEPAPQSASAAAVPPAKKFPSGAQPSKVGTGPSLPAKPKGPSLEEVRRMTAKEYKAYVKNCEATGLVPLAI